LENLGFGFQQGQEIFFIQAGSAAHPASPLMDTGFFSPGMKQSVYEADHSQ